jgi:hypothetical protein
LREEIAAKIGALRGQRPRAEPRSEQVWRNKEALVEFVCSFQFQVHNDSARVRSRLEAVI